MLADTAAADVSCCFFLGFLGLPLVFDKFFEVLGGNALGFRMDFNGLKSMGDGRWAT